MWVNRVHTFSHSLAWLGCPLPFLLPKPIYFGAQHPAGFPMAAEAQRMALTQPTESLQLSKGPRGQWRCDEEGQVAPASVALDALALTLS